MQCITMYYMATTSDTVLTVRIPSPLKQRLSTLARDTDRSVGYYVKTLLEQNISELEHANELQARARAVREGTARTYSADELRTELGL